MKVPQFTRSEEWTRRAGSVHRSTKFDGQARNCYVVEFAKNESSPLSVNLGVAPEKAQPFGQRSRQNLGALAFGKDVKVEWSKRDRYGRIVGKVWVQPVSCPTCPMTLDVGHAQITVGLAWWYRKYAGEPSPEDQGAYEFSEQEARAKRVGLWSEKDPLPPWEWRRN